MKTAASFDAWHDIFFEDLAGVNLGSDERATSSKQMSYFLQQNGVTVDRSLLARVQTSQDTLRDLAVTGGEMTQQIMNDCYPINK